MITIQPLIAMIYLNVYIYRLIAPYIKPKHADLPRYYTIQAHKDGLVSNSLLSGHTRTNKGLLESMTGLFQVLHEKSSASASAYKRYFNSALPVNHIYG